MYVVPEEITAELKAIDSIITEIESLYSNTDSDISSAWDSSNARGKVTPQIDSIKESISKIKAFIQNVNQKSGEFVAKVEEVDQV